MLKILVSFDVGRNFIVNTFLLSMHADDEASI